MAVPAKSRIALLALLALAIQVFGFGEHAGRMAARGAEAGIAAQRLSSLGLSQAIAQLGIAPESILCHADDADDAEAPAQSGHGLCVVCTLHAVAVALSPQAVATLPPPPAVVRRPPETAPQVAGRPPLRALARAPPSLPGPA